MSSANYRTALTSALAGIGLLSLLIAHPACSSFDSAADNSQADGGSDAADGGGGDATPTDLCAGRPTDPVCLDESKALFVSNPNGDDGTGVGTRDKPFKTINAALAKIDAAKRRIYICEGAYAEDLALTATHSGVSLFGGVDCKWAAASVKPVIGTSANPFKSDGATGVAIGDVAVEAKDATAGSSIAFFVHGGDVTLRNVRLKAGKGGAGSPGVAAPFTNFPSQTDLDGFPSPDTNTGGGERLVTCPGGPQTKGGKGGNAGFAGSPGTPGPANGGTQLNCAILAAQAGSSAASAPGASTPGTLDVAGWVSTPGTKGDTGGPGQGGGGGLGAAGGGGGGGAGGCGGAGGPGGQGGGASIALAALSATVTLSTSVLVATDGGPGGSGVIGQDGQTIFGIRGVAGGNCNGGAGGPGGAGGAGGGGAGGSSFGIVFKGSKPTTDPQTDSAIQFGIKGTGGQVVGTNPGVDGLASAVFESK